MIVSHKYKFIFIKTVKTAGTSIEVDLNNMLGDTDIATPIYPPIEGHQARNFIVKNELNEQTVFRNHMSGREVRKLVGAAIWDEYFTFCVEREPISKVISHYSMLVNSPYHNKHTKEMSFEEYVNKGKFPVDTEKYTDENGNLIVDRILKYEELDKELMTIANYIGLNLKLKTRAKSGFRMDLQITEKQSQIIYQAFSTSNQFTRYSFSK